MIHIEQTISKDFRRSEPASPQFGRRDLDWGESRETTLPHGQLLRLLRSVGFTAEDLIEIQAPDPAHPRTPSSPLTG